ncbi:cytochrome c oxidase assembly protein [Sulfitobacter aestuarii]|uniref:Cytochrome c oxidase assembly protein n=1 Tax=Sulfitobacter aestuarii TaxID=2161676 RepID=A0ABW5U3E0_9RHOB
MRQAATYAGLAVLAAIWLLPLQLWLGWVFPVHMLRHMALVAIAAPLLAIGLGARMPWLTISPLLASALEFAVVWLWHLPTLHGIAYLHLPGYVLEQAGFLAVGLLVWVSALRPGEALTGAGGLLVTSMHMTLLGALLILAPRDLFAAICGLAPDLGQQQIGGLLMLGIGTPVYLIGGLILVHGVLEGGEEQGV